jgi:hypothetical protein
MSIKFACSCGKAYKVPDKFSGKRVKCKQCGEPIRVPSESQVGVASTRASAVSKRSVLKSQRASKRSGQVSGRESARSGRKSRRVRKSKPGAKTERVEAVDLSEGNQIKRYQSKKQEEFKRGEGRLTYFENGKAVKAFRVNKKGAVVGRGDDCGVSLPDASVSDEHMKLEYKLGTFISTDLQSSNGVVINGRQLRRASLKNGDVIQLGSAVLRFDC